jgi:small subunit ribosomal protein S6
MTRVRVQREVMLVMRAYELMIIFDGEVDDTAVNEQLAAVGRLVEAGGGTVKKTDRWGRRRFAYEINHKWEGIYVVLEIATEGRDLSEVERVLHLADEVVRHKTIRLPEAEATRRGLLGEAAPAQAG